MLHAGRGIPKASWPDTNALRLRDDTPSHSSPATPRAPVDDRAAASQSQPKPASIKQAPLQCKHASFAQSSRCKSIRLAIRKMHEEPARSNCMPRNTIAKTKETKQYVSLTKHPDKPGWADVLEGMKPQLSVGLSMCLGVSRRRVTLDDGARA